MPEDRELEKVLNVDVKGKKIKIIVKRPGSKITNDAQRRGALVWTECVRAGVMTKKELKKYMVERGIWDDGKDEDEKAILDKITELEKELYLGTKAGKIKASKGKDLAIKMRVKRAELRDLLTERIGLEAHTAESLADNAKFDYLVAHCTYHDNGDRVYKDLDDYDSQSDDQIAFQAAAHLAEMIYVLDKDFEHKLPENKFLTKYEFVNDELSLVNKKGVTVDTKGRRINDQGHYLDTDGNRIDIDGNALEEDGTYVQQVTYLDDKGKPIKEVKSNKTTKSKEEDPKPKDETES